MADEVKTASPEQLFTQALELAKTGNHKDAATLFEAIRATGRTTAALERNLGRSKMLSGQPGEGIRYFENAVALNRWDGDARADLALAQSKVEGGFGEAIAHPAEWGARLASYARPEELCTVGVAGALLLITVRLFVRDRRRMMLTVLTTSLAVMGLGLSIFALTGRSIATLAADSELKSTPLASGETTLTLKTGTRLRVVRTSGDYSEVERPNGFRGWVPAKNIERLPF